MILPVRFASLQTTLAPSVHKKQNTVFNTQPVFAGIASRARITRQLERISRLTALEQQLQTLATDPNIESLDKRGLLSDVAKYLQARDVSPTLSLCIAISGPSAGGKTTNANSLLNHLNANAASYSHGFSVFAHGLSLDSFYRDKSEKKAELKIDRFMATEDLESPQAWDMAAFQQAILALKKRKPVYVNQYDYVTAKSEPKAHAEPSAVVYVIEGNHVLSNDPFLPGDETRLCDLFPIRLYAHTDNGIIDQRWASRVEKDRDKGIAGWALDAFRNSVEAGRERYIIPTKANAHIIINTANSPESLARTQEKLAQILFDALFKPLDTPLSVLA